MAKRIFAVFDRDKECTEHSVAWTGEIPCTGVLRCHLCGTTWNSREEYERDNR